MFVEALRLFHFRNLKEVTLTLSPGVNVFYGNNGQGKTNVVESLSLLSSTKSFRAKRTQELIQWGQTESSVRALIKDTHGTNTLSVELRKNQKTFYLNDKQSSAVDFVGKLLAITFSPADIDMVKGGPQERRRFIDRHLIDVYPHLLGPLLRYTKAIKNKQILLKAERPLTGQLDMWDAIIAESLERLLPFRRTLVSDLQRELAECYQSFAESDGEIFIRLTSAIPEGVTSAQEILNLLREMRSEELAARNSIWGIHRDDLSITLAKKSARSYSSQGQSKSIAVALKLAVIALLERSGKERPVIILDDIDSELDRGRCTRLYELVVEKGRQVFITGTEFNEPLRANAHKAEITGFFVESGNIETGVI